MESGDFSIRQAHDESVEYVRTILDGSVRLQKISAQRFKNCGDIDSVRTLARLRCRLLRLHLPNPALSTFRRPLHEILQSMRRERTRE